MSAGWQFAVDPPSLDTGPGSAPLVPTEITPKQVWMMGCEFTNPAANPHAVTVTVTDSAGTLLFEIQLPPGAVDTRSWNFRPSLGVKWVFSDTGAYGQLWGISAA